MSVVYFLQCTLTQRIKIGSTDDLTTRVAAINSSNCAPARLIAVVSGGIDVEAYLHRRFAKDRVNGEWFLPSAELAEVATSACFGRFPFREVTAASRPVREGYLHALADARVHLKQIGDELPRAAVRDKCRHAAARTGLSHSRVFDLWYSKARSISPDETAKIAGALVYRAEP
jgi:hypothetical protein